MSDSARHTYRIYGLTLVSDVKLTLPVVCCGRQSSGAIHIEHSRRFRSHQPEEFSGDEWEQTVFNDGSLRIRWENWIEFLISADGVRVFYRNLSRNSLDCLEAYLTTLAVGAALIQQGEEPLHATVVDIGGLAVGFLGNSGAGKSTLAAFLAANGGDVVTDDILRVTFDSDITLAHPGPHRLKLFAEPAQRFLPGANKTGMWSPIGNKYIYDLGEPTRDRAARRLSALYHLCSPSEGAYGRPSFSRLSGYESFQVVAASTMNKGLRNRGRPQRHFKFVSDLTSLVPVYRLTYPRSFEAFDEVAEIICRSAKPEQWHSSNS